MINEEIFPFKQFIKDYFAEYNGKSNRNGWYFQQLIKLYDAEINNSGFALISQIIAY